MMRGAMTSSKSFCVSATIAIERAPALTRSLTHCAPASVLPKPRPASASHVRHSPSGAIWFGLAQNRQSQRSSFAWSSLRLVSILWRSATGSEASKLAVDDVTGANVLMLNWPAILACEFDLIREHA